MELVTASIALSVTMNVNSVFTCVALTICLLAVNQPKTLCSQSPDTGNGTTNFTDQQLEFFESKVRPMLVEHCFECHGPEASPIEGGLSLASRKTLLTGGDTGPAVEPGHPDKSLLIDAINYGEVYEMPPDTKLSDEDIATLTKWVKDGAAWPKSSDVEVTVKKEFDLAARKAQHWCWQPVRMPNIPKVKNANWAKDPIDHFILEKVESAGLTPAPPADRRTLIRRAYFDLIGLPPPPKQVDSFVKDDSPNAFETVIDQLLDSPHFGERWARHWMDLMRYAETGGHEFDYPIPHAFRYRDYLIRAFNEDVSYKQFIHEHIAGDLLTNPRRHTSEDFDESVLGTGFWFLGEAKHGAVDSRNEEARTFDNQIDVMSKTFLGLTVACARCHDHKFDAISTEDYYALAGFLQSSRRQAAMLDPGRKIENSFDRATRLVDQGDQIVSKMSDRLKASDSSRVAKYVDAALTFLRADPDWNKHAVTIIESESLKQRSVSGGTTSIQKSNKRSSFHWRGNQQYWWRDGKVGDSWLLEFDVPKPAITDVSYEVAGSFTKAHDYGQARLSINDTVVDEKIDFYAPEGTTAVSSLGNVRLKPGKNLLKIEITGQHKDAAAGNMIGVDYLQITPVEQPGETNQRTVQQIALQKNVDAGTLQQLVSAIRDPATKASSHPLNLIFRASKQAQSIDSKFAAEISNSAKSRRGKNEKWLGDSTRFADFEGGLPSGWFKTGFAFGDSTTSDNRLFAASGPILKDPDTVSSGQFGKNFFGVIRSPTFELKHKNIHYRIRGDNATIRLIIDGFTMDQFNALLYKGCKFDIQPSEVFSWQTQSGDLQNHLGHRAHIEIIDHGNGFVEVDEIRFSNGSPPVDAPIGLTLAFESSEKGFDSQASFCQLAGQALVDAVANGSFDVSSWIIEHDLADVFREGLSPSASQSSINPGSPRAGFVATSNASSDLYLSSGLAADLKSVREHLDELNTTTPAPDLGLAMTEGTGEEEKIFIRGNHKTLGAVATRRFLSALSPRPLNPPNGSGRLQLAYKITAPNNPLTARVAVNRIWHHLFGRGIVESVDNLGVLGKTPTHPELLDYLASEFVADEWSLKHMIKRIALSQTYQMSSAPDDAAANVDPDNNLLHRARIRRLQGEAIRDSILQVSGSLDLKMYGSPIPIHLTSFMGGRGRPKKSGPIDGDGRRSIYIAVRRNFLSPMMLAFDTPIPFNAIGKRNQSNVPAQALIMMNDPFVMEQAKQWAHRLLETNQSTAQRIETIYLSALGRAPSQPELEQASAFFKIQAKELKIKASDLETNEMIWQDFCHIVFSLKEFIYIN